METYLPVLGMMGFAQTLRGIRRGEFSLNPSYEFA